MERYQFSPDTLSYQLVVTTRKQKLIRFFSLLGLTFLLGTAILLLRDSRMNSPRVDRLVAEQQQMTHELGQMNRDIRHYEQVLQDVAFHDDRIFRVYFEVEAFPETQRFAGVGGSRRYDYLQDRKHGELLASVFRGIDQIERKIVVQSSSFDEVIEMAANKEARLAARPAIQPISMKDLVHFGSAFGMRYHPILKIMRPHNGIDLTAPRGTSIFATADGTVLQAGYRPGGFGNKVLLDHGYGYRTLYGHCDEVLVKPGQEVKRGELIARVGNTGLSKSHHLHYEVHVNGRPVDPIDYYTSDLSAAEYETMIEMLADADPNFDIN
ncbi:MAG: peptidase M23 [Bacteroidetes bacterium]|nr:MAG: peptidase M23 [Bacteroidota bacterium]